MEIRDSVALVTGANRGIGAAVVDALAAAGARRVYAGVRAELKESAGSSIVEPVTIDITDAAQVADAARTCADVQILVNNAGIGFFKPLVGSADTSAAEQEMQVNYFGT